MHDSEKPADNRHPGLSTVQEGSSPRRQKPPAARSPCHRSTCQLYRVSPSSSPRGACISPKGQHMEHTERPGLRSRRHDRVRILQPRRVRRHEPRGGRQPITPGGYRLYPSREPLNVHWGRRHLCTVPEGNPVRRTTRHPPVPRPHPTWFLTGKTAACPRTETPSEAAIGAVPTVLYSTRGTAAPPPNPQRGDRSHLQGSPRGRRATPSPQRSPLSSAAVDTPMRSGTRRLATRWPTRYRTHSQVCS